MNEYRYRIIRDLDDLDRPEAHVETIGDTVLLSLYRRRRKVRDAQFGVIGARWLAAGLVLATEQADRYARRADAACEGEKKGGGL